MTDYLTYLLHLLESNELTTNDKKNIITVIDLILNY